jgi:TolA-binding protein/Tfp pilus assembly protein PilF
VAARADATDDLARGRELIAAGDFEKGLAALTAAAQNHPQAVEPQLALAEAYLKLGDSEKAITHFRKVLALSPEHAQARRIVEALTGRRQTVAERIELAKSFIAIGAFKPAESTLRQAMADAANADERDSVRAMLAQTLLWSGNTAGALDEAGRLMQSAKRSAEGRVLAALALVGQKDPDIESASKLLAAVELPKEGEPPDWSKWHEVAKLLVQLTRGDEAVEVSRQFGKPLGAVPSGPLRQTLMSRAATALLAKAREEIGRGHPENAASILWPLMSSDNLPGNEQALKTIDLKGGWLDRTAAAGPFWLQVSQVFGQIGKADFDSRVRNVNLINYWIAAEIARQAPPNVNRVEQLLQLARELAAFSRAADNRKPGTVLSRADEVQFAILTQAIPLAADENQRVAIIDLVVGQITRYQQAEAIETGLSQIAPPAPLREIKAGERVHLAAPFNALPVGTAHQKLLNFLADRFAELGNKAFQSAKTSLDPTANEQLQPHDRTAIHLYGELAALYPSGTNSVAAIDAIIQRYTSTQQWAAATDATVRFYAHLSGNAGRWAAIRLKIAQAQQVENETLAAQRQLPDELPSLVVEALADALKIATEIPGKPSWRAAVQLAEPLVNRYADLERYDLAASVIAAMAGSGDEAPLADWAAWAQIQLVDRQASRAVALATQGLDPRTKLPLNEFHKRELELLVDFIAKFRETEYIASAVERVIQIAGVYQSHHSFDVARDVLADFLKAHPKLEYAQRIELQIAQIAVAKARAAFNDRKEKTKPPEELSAEFAAAIEALAAFLKAHPRGALAQSAENELLQIARTYGEVGSWPVARDVIERFAQAVPDFRSPAQLQLLRAATYLGELDRNYGLSLLQPTIAVQASSTPGNPTDTKALGGFAAAKRLGDADEKSANGPVAQSGAEAAEIGGRFSGGGGTYANSPSAALSRPSVDDLALAKVRQSQHEHLASIAMIETNGDKAQSARAPGRDVALPAGPVLSAAAMKRQDEASDKAYEILIKLVADTDLANAAAAQQARAHIHWMFGLFEGQLRPDRAVVLIRRYLGDRSTEPARVSLAYRVLTDLINYAALQQPTDRNNKTWIDQRHERFQQARAEIAKFIDEFSDRRDWVEHAQILRIDSFDREAQLAAQVSPIRAAGLLLQAADAITDLFHGSPEHPAIVNFPERLWNLAERLVSLDQQEQAIHVLSQIPMFFPTHPRSHQAVLRQAELYAANLRNPLRAVETYLEYLGLAGDNEAIRSQIYTIGDQLAAAQRYLEAIHVYSAFVDSFPTDPRAAQALLQIGQTHQSNQAWKDAMQAYARIVAEYPAAPIAPQVKLAMAECHINLSQWRSARTLYEEYVQQYAGDPQAEMARVRIEVLKNLDRYQTLLADDAVQRNKDDAQFQIGMIVLEKLANPVKAVAEFRKVVANYPKSPQADDAQLEIGKALLTLGQLGEARVELLKVAQNYPGSPLADDALYLIGQSYERDAQRLAAVTSQKARADAFERQQRGAYAKFNEDQRKKDLAFSMERDALKREGRKEELDLSEAAQAFRAGSANLDTLSVTARQAAISAETESALQVANRQDRINEAFRRAVEMYAKSAAEYPLGDMTDDALLRMAEIYETELKDRVAAMEAYQKVVKVFPGTPVAEDAAWKVAQFHEREGKHQQAVDAYRDFIRSYPASARVADAQFAMAEALEQLGRWVEAMDAYETFRQKFTAHPKAQVALEQINWIKAYRK